MFEDILELIDDCMTKKESNVELFELIASQLRASNHGEDRGILATIIHLLENNVFISGWIRSTPLIDKPIYSKIKPTNPNSQPFYITEADVENLKSLHHELIKFYQKKIKWVYVFEPGEFTKLDELSNLQSKKDKNDKEEGIEEKKAYVDFMRDVVIDPENIVGDFKVVNEYNKNDENETYKKNNITIRIANLLEHTKHTDIEKIEIKKWLGKKGGQENTSFIYPLFAAGLFTGDGRGKGPLPSLIHSEKNQRWYTKNGIIFCSGEINIYSLMYTKCQTALTYDTEKNKLKVISSAEFDDLIEKEAKINQDKSLLFNEKPLFILNYRIELTVKNNEVIPQLNFSLMSLTNDLCSPKEVKKSKQHMQESYEAHKDSIAGGLLREEREKILSHHFFNKFYQGTLFLYEDVLTDFNNETLMELIRQVQNWLRKLNTPGAIEKIIKDNVEGELLLRLKLKIDNLKPLTAEQIKEISDELVIAETKALVAVLHYYVTQLKANEKCDFSQAMLENLQALTKASWQYDQKAKTLIAKINKNTDRTIAGTEMTEIITKLEGFLFPHARELSVNQIKFISKKIDHDNGTIRFEIDELNYVFLTALMNNPQAVKTIDLVKDNVPLLLAKDILHAADQALKTYNENSKQGFFSGKSVGRLRGMVYALAFKLYDDNFFIKLLLVAGILSSSSKKLKANIIKSLGLNDEKAVYSAVTNAFIINLEKDGKTIPKNEKDSLLINIQKCLNDLNEFIQGRKKDLIQENYIEQMTVEQKTTSIRNYYYRGLELKENQKIDNPEENFNLFIQHDGDFKQHVLITLAENKDLVVKEAANYLCKTLESLITGYVAQNKQTPKPNRL